MMKNVETPHEKPTRNPSAVLRAENTAKKEPFCNKLIINIFNKSRFHALAITVYSHGDYYLFARQ